MTENGVHDDVALALAKICSNPQILDRLLRFPWCERESGMGDVNYIFADSCSWNEGWEKSWNDG